MYNCCVYYNFVCFCVFPIAHRNVGGGDVVGRIILPSSFAVNVSVPLSFYRLPRTLPSCLQQSSADVSTCRAEAVIVFRIVRRRGEDRRQSEFDVHCSWLSRKLRLLSLLRCRSTSSGTPVSTLSLLKVWPRLSVGETKRRRVENRRRELSVREPGRPLVYLRATTWRSRRRDLPTCSLCCCWNRTLLLFLFVLVAAVYLHFFS